jgi:hypothetical protein
MVNVPALRFVIEAVKEGSFESLTLNDPNDPND